MNDWLQKWIRKLELNEDTVSTVLGGVVLLVVGFLFYNYFTYNRQQKQVEIAESESEVQDGRGGRGQTSSTSTTKYSVVEGDTLWSIAESNYQDGYKWVEIAKVNELTSPNIIEVGQELDLPGLPQVQQRQAEVEGDEVVVSPKSNEDGGDTQDMKVKGSYTVQKGDFLWKIALEKYGDGYKWTQIWRANREEVVDPNILVIGSVLNLP